MLKYTYNIKKEGLTMFQSSIQIGTTIRYLRKQNNLTQEQLAKDICSTKYIYTLEKNLCSPTTNILTRLSEKLKVDIYSCYQNMCQAGSIDTYEKLELLSETMGRLDTLTAYHYAQEWKDLPSFHLDHPMQCLQYVFSSYALYQKDYQTAIQYALQGLQINHSELTESNITTQKDLPFSNIELLLINCIAVSYSKQKDFTYAYSILRYLINYLRPYTKLSNAAIHQSYHFHITFFCMIITNLLYIQHTLGYTEDSLTLLDEAINICKRLCYSNSLYVLLEEKAIYHYKQKNLPTAKQLFEQASVLQLYSPKSEQPPQEYLQNLQKKYPDCFTNTTSSF